MDDGQPWQLWLEQLYRLYVALDKVGAHIFPHDAAHGYVKGILFEIFSLYERIDEYVLANPDVKVTDEVDATVLKILKASAQIRNNFLNEEIYDEFNDTVKAYVKEMLANRDYFVPDQIIWFSEASGGSVNSCFNVSTGKDSFYVEWHPDGEIRTVGSFKDGSPSGVWTAFNRKGKLMSRYDHTVPTKRKQQMIKNYSDQISLVDPEPESQPEKTEELGIGSVLLGSLAALTLTSLFKKTRPSKVKRGKSKKSQSQVKAQVQEVETIQV